MSPKRNVELKSSTDDKFVFSLNNGKEITINKKDCSSPCDDDPCGDDPCDKSKVKKCFPFGSSNMCGSGDCFGSSNYGSSSKCCNEYLYYAVIFFVIIIVIVSIYFIYRYIRERKTK